MSYELRTQSPADLTQMMLAEYESLRQEIGRFQDHQKEIMNFAYIVVLALATAGAALEAHPTLQKVIIFLIPWSYLLLAGAYTDRTLKLLLAAGYIHKVLRPKACKVLGCDVWEWENFKRWGGDLDRQVFWTMDKFRWLVFVLPALFGAAVCAFLLWPPQGWRALVITADLLPVALAFYVMFLADEASGVYGNCDPIFRPEPLSGWLLLATVTMPALLILQFPLIGFLTSTPVVLGISLAACCVGLAAGAAELLYYANYRLQADREFVYRVSMFGHVTRWQKPDVTVRCVERLSRWSPLTIELKHDGQRFTFKVVGGHLEKWEGKTWKPVTTGETARSSPQLAEQTETLLKRDLLGLAAGRSG